jgi:hypothetical protein
MFRAADRLIDFDDFDFDDLIKVELDLLDMMSLFLSDTYSS